jgi:hypothetical protein
MKKISIIIIATVLMSCGREEKEEVPQIDYHAEAVDEANSLINQSIEQITLLAISKNISIDTLNQILQDYYTLENLHYNISSKQIDSVITATSIRLNIKKSRVANLVYCFKYEMITRDEIFEIELEKAEAEAEYEAEYEAEAEYRY